ncbi:lipopolysaccharide biosynthesis protein [Butyrivibrio hungatei]|uniref:lipopolysaccharide biosynthesis protein n=1 Tax=Butyrivibrio hungatei TaxID=185008 RepID=UPI00040E0DF2|nr:lipopolysaccharide biosynthesis protein [Butyrivibrio hungatei]
MRTISNIIWRLMEKVGVQIAELIITFIVARIIGPKAYGTLAIILSIIAILNVFVDGGLASALVQKKDIDDVDIASVFFFNIFFCAVIYIGLYMAASYIASFYRKNDLVAMIRIAGLIIIISGVKNVQQAIITRYLQFKKFFWATIIGTFISAIIGINMALRGWGTWSLIVQVVSNALIDTVILWLRSQWKPRFVFSLKKLKVLLSYGIRIMFSNFIDVLYGNMRQLLMGRYYSDADLAFYNRGRSLPKAFIENINASIDNVIFPVISIDQDNPIRVKEIVRKTIVVSNYLITPLLMFMFVAAEGIIKLLLTEKWLDCVFYMRVFCVIYIFQPIHTANINALKAMGKSNYVLRIEVIKKIVGVSTFLLVIPYGMKAIMWAYLANNFFDQLVNSYPNKRMIGYSYFNQIIDIMPCILSALILGSVSWWIGKLNIGFVMILVLQFLIVALYFAISIVFKFESYKYINEIIRQYIKNIKRHV